MRLTIDIPPDIERMLIAKCEEAGVSPSDFVISLLEWYFLKRKKGTQSSEIHELLRVAKENGEMRIKLCKYSDGTYCALEVFDDIVSEKEPEPITPFKCLFCPYFVDKRRAKEKLELTDVKDAKVYDIAKLAAKFVVELYGDKLGYRARLPIEEDKDVKAEEADEFQLTKKEISKKEVKKLLEDW
jgi:hypothetical protein